MSFFEALQSEVSFCFITPSIECIHDIQTLGANLSPVEMGIE